VVAVAAVPLAACGAGASARRVAPLSQVRDSSALAQGVASSGTRAPSRASAPAGASGPHAPLAGKTVAIDPGHNGGNATHPAQINRLVPAGGFMKACDTTGTETDSGFSEAQFNLDVALKVARILRSEGARVVLTRTTNTGIGPCVNERAAIGNRAHANVAISIHADGFSSWGRGFQVLRPGLVRGYTRRIVMPSARLARILRNRMERESGLTPSDYAGHDGIVVRTDLGGLNLSKVPMVFLECGNMKNPHDSTLQTSSRWRGRLARVVAGALRAYLTSAG
jgi:N-acetylmuramoyl-L-alanine amidase